jgi:hypothetical protein
VTFDAWSTPQAISAGQYRELNPALRPFVGNASLYAAIRPLAFDYLDRRMMTRSYCTTLRKAIMPTRLVETYLVDS